MTDGLSGCAIGTLEERVEALTETVDQLQHDNEELRDRVAELEGVADGGGGS